MYPRTIYQELFAEQHDRKITILVGPRQVGKTTLLRELEQHIQGKKLYLDLDLISNYEQVSTYERLIDTITSKGYSPGERFTLFLDEFQRYDDTTLVLKNVYDHHPEIKVYATGSSSITIKSRVQESLAGRKYLHNIYPLSFKEFLVFKNKQVENLERVQGRLIELEPLLEEYLVYGGYPDVVLATTQEQKQKALASIFDTYVKKELVNYVELHKLLGMKKLIEYLAINNAQKIKTTEIHQYTNLSIQEISSYLEILKETYLITEIRPFHTNKNVELKKIPKIYFLDTGVRNYFLDVFTFPALTKDMGYLFESFVLQELIKKGQKNIHFWQNKNRQEVDFVIDQKTHLQAIEVKYKTIIKPQDGIGLKAFKQEYSQALLSLINLGLQTTTKEVQYFLPYDINV